MPRSLHGITVAHFEARRASELSGLITRHGGIPWSAPALSEIPTVPRDDDRVTIERLAAREFDVVVLLTGMGTQRLFEEAAWAGRLDDTIDALRRTTLIARGPKPVTVLRRYGLRPTRIAPEPHTTTALLATLDHVITPGARALVLTAGECVSEPTTTLRARGADVVELQLYAWALAAADAARIGETIDEIIAGTIAAVLFTTQVQVRHLLGEAARRGITRELIAALREHVLIGAVGPTVDRALTGASLHADIVPRYPKMGHLVVALAEHVTPQARIDGVSLTDYANAVLDGRGDLR